MPGPRITSGEDSKQDYATPNEFIAAVERRFGKITLDLAAHSGNAKCNLYFAPPEFIVKTGRRKDKTYKEVRTPNKDPKALAFDSLTQKWHAYTGLSFLNPPFDDITPWAKKCAVESIDGARIALLVPASVGSNWARDFVFPHADVYILSGRLSFDGKDPYPKDCMLAVYGDGRPNIQTWCWEENRVLNRKYAPLGRAAAAFRADNFAGELGLPEGAEKNLLVRRLVAFAGYCEE